MTSEERLKELVMSGIGSKPYNVQRVVGANMVADFVSCKLDVILVECDCEGKYTTGMQVSLLEKDLRIGDEKNVASSKKLGNSECVVLSLDESDKETVARLTQIEDPKGNIKLITNGVSQGNI